ncbi:MAG: cyclophilin-like family protein [Nitrosopumilaceae archaeon]
MSAGSVSRHEIILDVKGKSQLRCELKRHLAPMVVGNIIRALPIEGNAHIQGNGIAYVETRIDSGVERQRKAFRKGDIAFLPSNSSICFVFNDIVSAKPMSPIGKILSNVEALGELKPGDVFLITQAT